MGEEDPSHALDPVTAVDHDLSLGLDQEIVSVQKKDEDGLDRDLNLGLRSAVEVVTDQIQNQGRVQDLARNLLAGKKIRSTTRIHPITIMNPNLKRKWNKR